MNRKGRFSWRRLLDSAFPNLLRDEREDVDLLPAQADNLVWWQISTPTPAYLSEEAFYIAGLTSSRIVSKKIHQALIKHKLIAPAPASTSAHRPSQSSCASACPPPSFEQPTPPVNTAGITRDFVGQLSIISVHAQRKLVGLLFFWEEECMRWNLLAQEEAEILNAMGYQHVDNNDLDFALKAVEMKRLLLPSLRAEATVNISQGVGHELPSYHT
jgi:hypothetical protein